MPTDYHFLSDFFFDALGFEGAGAGAGFALGFALGAGRLSQQCLHGHFSRGLL
jgi:hypothetical protein